MLCMLNIPETICMSGRAGTTRKSSHPRSKKRKRMSAPTTPTHPKSPSRKAARADCRKVLIVGFPNKEKINLKNNCPSGIEILENLSPELSHIVLKPPTKDKDFNWSELYYAILSGCWILRSSWLIESKKKKKVMDEKSHTLSSKDFKQETNSDQLSMEKMMKLYEHYEQCRKRNKAVLFSTEVFMQILILSEKSNEGKKKKSDLKSIIEAGGGHLCPNKVFNTIKMKPMRAEGLISAIIIVNGSSLCSLSIGLDFVRSILIQRIPILYEEFIIKLIEFKMNPALDDILKQCISYWCHSHPEKLELSPEDIQKILPGYLENISEFEKPIKTSNSKESRIRSHPTTRSQQSFLACEHVSNRLSDEDGENLLEEIEKEIVINEEKYGSSKIAATEISELEREQQRMVIYDDPLSDHDFSIPVIDDFGLDSIDLTSNNADEVFGEPEALAWNKWMAMLKYAVPKALARSGVETGSQPEESCVFFDAVVAEMKCNDPSTLVHDLVCYDAVNFIRHSIHDLFLPPPSTLSLLLHHIAMPEFGGRFDVASSIYRLLTYFLHQFPPSNAEGRYYWLQVLTHIEVKIFDVENRKSKRNLSHGNNLQCRVTAFRKLILDIFTGKSINQQLMELVVHILEADLFGMEGCGGLGGSQEVVDYGEMDELSQGIGRKSINLLEPLNCSADLDGIPLAYLVFYDYNERRKRGLDQSALKTCMAVIDLLAHKKNMFITNLCCRFLCVCLEAVRLFQSEVTKIFRGKCIPHDLQTDIERVARHFIIRGFDRQEVLQLMPVDWIYNIVKVMRF